MKLKSSLFAAALVFTSAPAFADNAQVASAPAPAPAPAPKPAEEVYIPVSLTLVPGLSTNGFVAGNVKNNLSLGLIATYAGRVDGAAFSPVLNWTDKPSRLAEFAGVGNFAGGGFTGAQFAGALNLSMDKTTGGQFAGAFNLTRNDFHGMQAAGGLNLAQGDVIGVQAAAAANIASGEVTGLQTAGGISLANGIHGAQISVINVGGDVTGAQIGVINLARRVKGLQLGIVNVSSEIDGAPIGIVSIAGNGQLHVQAYATDVTYTNVALKYGSKYVYSLVTAGYQPGDVDHRRFALGLGIGGHVPLDRFYVDIDGIASHLSPQLDWNSNDNLLSQLRVVAGYELVPHLSVFAGLTGNVWIKWHGADLTTIASEASFLPTYEKQNAHNSLRIWPGFVAGVQL